MFYYACTVNSWSRNLNQEITVNIDEFIQALLIAIETLPTKELELCDLSNELGLVIANLAGSDKSLEMEVTTGIEHGFDLVRRRDESAEDLE